MKNVIQDAKKLEQMIKERQEILSKFLEFVIEILKNGGEKILHEVKDYSTHSILELKNFSGFTFFGEFGQSQFGGNDIKVSFAGKPVMHVYSEGSSFNPKDKHFRVEIFDASSEWQQSLSALTEQKEQIIAKLLKTQQKKLKTERAKNTASQNFENLEEEAVRLGLS